MGITKTSMGLEENIAELLCYVLGWLTGIIFLVLEKENKFVRFHAVQSIIVFGGLFILSLIVGIVVSILLVMPFIGWSWIAETLVGLIGLISLLIPLVVVILWILLMVKAYQGEMYKLPIVGGFAEKQL